MAEVRPLVDAVAGAPPLTLTPLEDLAVWKGRLRDSLFDPPPRAPAGAAAGDEQPGAGLLLLRSLRAAGEEAAAGGMGPVLAAARRAGVYEGPAEASELYAAAAAAGGGRSGVVPTIRLESRPRTTQLGGELRPAALPAAGVRAALPPMFVEWSAEEVGEWLRGELGMPAAADAFVENDVGGELAAELDDEELENDLGVASRVGRARVLIAIAAKVRDREHPVSHGLQLQSSLWRTTRTAAVSVQPPRCRP